MRERLKQSFLILFFSILLCLSNCKSKIEVKINEISTNNKNALIDVYGEKSNWIEIYNSGKNTVDISGYGLSNEFYIPFKWAFPKNTTINSDEYLIVYVSNKKTKDGEFHTNFELNKEGDILYFTDSKAELIEKIEIPYLQDDETFGRDENDEFKTMLPSPETKNVKDIKPPKFSKKSGFYDDEFLLTLSTEEQSEIFYTIDGSNPFNSVTVQKYTEPIKIYDRSEEPNIYSEIGDDRDSPTFIGPLTGYSKPKYLLDKAMIIRAFCINEEGISKIITQSYFVTTGQLAQYKNITTISIVTNPENLFDPDKGIYVVGYKYLEEMAKITSQAELWQKFWQINGECNYSQRGQEWERESSVSIFKNGNLVADQNMGLRIKGSSTRSAAGKSFNLYARKKYGKEYIEYPLFPNNYDVDNQVIDKYKSITLRSVYSDERIRDEVVSKIIYDSKYDAISDTKKCIVFINGEYWGFYVIIERFNEEYFQSHYKIPRDDVLVYREGDANNVKEYINFMETYSQKDLTSKEVFNEIDKYIEVNSLVEYFVIGIYIGIWDWPNHNDGIWKNGGVRIKKNPYTDGRWRYILYDFDFTMGRTYEDYGGVEGYEYNNFKHLSRNEDKIGFPNDFFKPFLKNEEFRNRFALMFCDYANDLFNIDRIKTIINDYTENYLDELSECIVRWRNYDNGTKEEAFENYKNMYIKEFDQMITFFEERPKYAFDHMKEYLNITGELTELTIIKKGKGLVKINNNIIPDFKDGKWTGKYFTDIPLRISTIHSEDITYKKWSVYPNENITTIVLSEPTTITVNIK